ncbi:MAG: 4-(cytidine 5'-diphospho)-2-C-methyl-D-erythritol kinase [Candidatus Adiutrix sp.]|jgi:4-diphosphocytidyl-2-C-methyl-D-erythritol kinase|nr:4-(cytidine 5'-diphospho)-2-C-methyl-D-erythritol kinase [Candidatus Adiutrix sp.]
MDATVHFQAPAKINLALRVLGRRPDGCHELDSVMARLALADRLSLGPAGPGPDRLSARTSLAEPLPPDFEGPANLVLRAVRAFRNETGWPGEAVSVTLEKNIPWGAGLGGGSADGAAVLATLNRAAPKPLPAPRLAALALDLGADLPFCLAGTALARAGGTGEKLSAPPPAFDFFRGRKLWLVKPGFSLATGRVFGNLGLTNPPPEHNLEPAPQPGENDLLAPALRLAPALGEVVRAIRELRPGFWGLSGSGPTFWIYGAGEDPARLARARPDWWIRASAVVT